MQLVTQLPQQVAGRSRGVYLARRQETALARLAEAGHLVARARDPERGLQIAQPALAVLEVRLEQPYRAAVALAALVVLVEFVADELVDLARLQLGDGGALERLEELRVARDEPPVEERGADGVVLTGRLETLLERARGVARFEAGVPEGAVEALGDQLRAGPEGFLLGEQSEQIDVGARRQLAPPVSAGGHQRQRRLGPRLRLGADGLEQLADDPVGQVGDGAHHLLAAGPGAVAVENLGATLLESLTRALDGVQ